MAKNYDDDWDYAPRSVPQEVAPKKKAVKQTPVQQPIQNITVKKGAGPLIWIFCFFLLAFSVVNFALILNYMNSGSRRSSSADVDFLEEEIMDLQSKFDILESEVIASREMQAEEPIEEIVPEEPTPTPEPETAEESLDNAASAFGDIVSKVADVVTDAVDDTLVDPDFKAVMDSYEAFFDEYIDFMERYEAAEGTGDYLNMMAEYFDWLERYAETMDKLNDVDSDSLSAADLAYYTLVMKRINDKIANAI